jgi:hypothetical protein
MPKKKAQSENQQACAWMIAIPMRAEFTQPLFHFGERVKWFVDHNASQFWLSGRITGMLFVQPDERWEYLIRIDPIEPPAGIELDETALLEEMELKLVNDADAIRNALLPITDWQTTDLAARSLGLSPDQLRNLRLKGFFNDGYHVRDTSVPNSRRPYWQWHIQRCEAALEASKKSRLQTKRLPKRQ